MTTPQAERAYEAQHVKEWSGHGNEIHNPLSRPITDLPTIYGFNNGGPSGWMSGVLIAEDGDVLGGHTCSSEAYMPHDLGILKGSRPDRHEEFQKHYPDGYKMEFVSFGDIDHHEALKAAIEIAKANAEKEAANPTTVFKD